MNRSEKTVLWVCLVCGLVLLGGLGYMVVSGFSMQDKQRRRQRDAVREQLAAIEQAVRFYSGRMGKLPPSDPAEVARCGAGRVGADHAGTGAEALHFFLRGWYVDEDGKVVRGKGFRRTGGDGVTRAFAAFYTSDLEADVAADDAERGFGGAGEGVVFADRFEHHRPILYFRAEPGALGNPFDRTHNAKILYHWQAPDAQRFETLAQRARQRSEADFLIWSAGPDGMFLSDDDVILP